MIRWKRTALAVAAMAACEGGAAGDVKIARGQEFLYTGTVEWKQASTGRPPVVRSGTTTLSAFVAEAERASGYTLVLLRRVNPRRQPRQPHLPAEAQVVVCRLRTDFTPARDPVSVAFSTQLFGVMSALHAPVLRHANLSAGHTWRLPERPAGIMPLSQEVSYAVTGKTTAAGRPCVTIEEKIADRRPPQQIVAGIGMAPGYTQTLTDFTQLLCVDPATGQVVRETLRARTRLKSQGQQVTQEVSAQLTLVKVRQLSPSETASRARQVPALERLQNGPRPARSSAEQIQALADAVAAVTAFRKSYPTSPYLPAVAAMGARLRGIRVVPERSIPPGAAGRTRAVAPPQDPGRARPNAR